MELTYVVYLVKNFVQAGNKCDLLGHDGLRRGVQDPHLLGNRLDAPNVRVRTEQDVLELGLFLVDPLHGHPLVAGLAVGGGRRSHGFDVGPVPHCLEEFFV